MSEAEKPAQTDQLDSIRDVERLLLDAAKAIQRLIGERDELRRRVDTLESELARLRKRTALTHESYRRLGTEFVTQLQLLDSEVGDLFREPAEATDEHSGEQQPAGAAMPNSSANHEWPASHSSGRPRE